MNGIAGFAMLFYTLVMGMSPALVGTALAIATIWDAITDPVMGTISDRTNTRYGRRHPYMLVGGIFLALSFFAFWYVPETFRGEKLLFFYLIVVNIVVKTAFTVYFVPYTALGFEMCKTANERSRIQGVRFGVNMIVNIVFVAFGWVLFFKDGVDADGSRIDGTRIAGNFLNMGAVLTLSALILIIVCVFTTFKYANPTLEKTPKASASENIKAFFSDVKDVYSDPLVWFVFGFYGLAQFSMMVVSQVQMFTYVDYMEFTDKQKTFVHTGGMFAFMLGAFMLGTIVRKLDKKKTGYLAMLISSAGGLGLLLVFSGGLIEPRTEGGGLPLAVIVFGLLQMLWWGGCGIIVPLAASMIADLSEVKKWQTGEATEGRYAAGFSFFLKSASALGLFVTGFILKGVGYESGAEKQSLETINNLALMTFITGPILMLCAFFVLRWYPITKEVLENLRIQYGQPEDEA